MNGATDRALWLAGLKPGDEVLIRSSRFSGYDYTLGRVEKVTPSGRIVLENGTTFNPDGRERVKSDGWYGRDALVEPTQEIRDMMIKDKLVSEIQSFGERRLVRDLSLDQLERIVKIMTEGKSE